MASASAQMKGVSKIVKYDHPIIWMNTTLITSRQRVKGVDISEIYSENVAAKIFQVAQKGLKKQVCRP